METTRWNLKNDEIYNRNAILEAAARLKKGETVAFPTETVYGLGADATNAEAVGKIFTAKGRPQDNPLIAHVATAEQLKGLVDSFPDYVEKLIQAYSPGPLTYVLPSNGTCATNVTAGLPTIAVRIPDHPIALAILKETNLPIAAPSANLSGKPSPTTADHVWEDLHGKISGLVDGGATGVGVESTVIACNKEGVVILRPGGITKEQLQEIVPVFNASVDKPDKPASPGMKYKHYAPEVPLWLVEGSVEEIQSVINEEQAKGKRVALLASNERALEIEANESIKLGENISEVASNLYEALRTFKKADIDLIIAQTFPETGIGQAVMNRLKKAATKYIEK